MSISYLRPDAGAERSALRAHRRLTSRRRGPRPWHYGLAFAVVLVAALAIVAALVASSSATLSADSSALAKIGMPLGGGKVQSVTVRNARGGLINVDVTGSRRLWPQQLISTGDRLTITVVVKRPGWISWLAGSTQTLHMTLVAPSASLRSHFITIRQGQPLRLRFKQPVSAVAYGQPGQLQLHLLSTPQTVITVGQEAPAGTITVEATPRRWERTRPAFVSWFPAGSGVASAVASPAPGTQISSTTPLTLTFSKPVSSALGTSRPAITPATTGTWTTLNAHTIRFVPSGYGYGLATPVSIGLPHGIRLVGGQSSTSASSGSWSVPAGSTLRLQQLLAMLGYLPVKFHYAGAPVAPTPAAQEHAAIDPPQGSFSLRYRNTPSELQAEWKPGASGVMTQGALMAFENTEGLTPDGVAGAEVWKALMAAAIAGRISTFGYTFVHVSEGSPETESTWHNGKTVVSGLVNTGIASRPTALGIYPVFEHALSVTMSGTNPDGSHYRDPGVPYVSYFNGGDALHGFIRSGYGYPQSLGCVEMPYSEASQVYPYTPIGTLVDVT